MLVKKVTLPCIEIWTMGTLKKRKAQHNCGLIYYLFLLQVMNISGYQYNFVIRITTMLSIYIIYWNVIKIYEVRVNRKYHLLGRCKNQKNLIYILLWEFGIWFLYKRGELSLGPAINSIKILNTLKNLKYYFLKKCVFGIQDFHPIYVGSKWPKNLKN